MSNVTVQGYWLDSLGNPVSGQLMFAPSSPVLNPGASIVYYDTIITNLREQDGFYSVVLPANDSPGLTTGWAWLVTPTIRGRLLPTQRVAVLSAAGPVQSLASLFTAS